MQPAFVEPLTEEQLNEADDEDTIQDDMKDAVIHTNIVNAVNELRLGIYAIKRKMFDQIVSQDPKNTPGDLGPMMTFHSLFLQTLGYWIGLLDSKPVPPPSLPKSILKDFKALTNAIDKVAHEDSDARVLVYNTLFDFSTQHPYDLGAQQNSDDEE